MEEIEVGDYVRTKAGIIRKIDKIERCPVCKEKEYINTENIKGLCFENTYHKDDIVKHSFCLLELIEVGDYVNCSRVEETSCKLEYNDDYGEANNVFDGLRLENGWIYFDYEIESILTKEQYKANCYEVK